MPLETLPRTAGVVTYPAGATFGPRRMTDFEFVWLIEGDAEYTVDGRTYAVPRGALVLNRPGTTDHFQWDRTRSTRHAYIHLDVLRSPPDWPPVEQWPVVRALSDGHVQLELFRQLIRPGGLPQATVAAAVCNAMLALHVLGTADSDGVTIAELPDAVARAYGHLHRTLDDDPATPIDLATLADVACVTPEHLCRLFRRSLSVTPVRAVLLGRLDRAADLLRRSNLSAGEVATLCGFASAFHFSRRFKAAFGYGPREYRRRIEEGQTPPTPRLLRQHRHNER